MKIRIMTVQMVEVEIDERDVKAAIEDGVAPEGSEEQVAKDLAVSLYDDGSVTPDHGADVMYDVTSTAYAPSDRLYERCSDSQAVSRVTFYK